MSTLYKRSSYAQAVECEGEWVIIQIKHDTITKLNAAAGAVWSLLYKSMTVNQLMLVAGVQKNPIMEASAADVEVLLEHLVQIGLVEKW